MFSTIEQPKQFTINRNPLFLKKLLRNSQELRAWLKQKVRLSPNQRHVKVKLFSHYLRYPFGNKQVNGILIAFNTLEEYELFGERHFFETIKALIPNAQQVIGSFYPFDPPLSSIHLAYLEIAQPQNLPSSFKENIKQKVGEHIQRLIPASFSAPNQEEFFHKLSLLDAEVKEETTLPQVVISYEEHGHRQVQFSVVLLRLISSSSIPVKTLFQNLEPSLEFLSIHTGIIGKVGKRYKEANVFSLRFDISFFLRYNLAIDLYKARQFVAQITEKALGPFRDFNGGLIQKQLEALLKLKMALAGQEAKLFLLEDFFFSLTPISSQGIFPTSPLKELFLLLLKAKNSQLLYQKKEEEGYLAEVVKIEEKGLQKALEEPLSEIGLQKEEAVISRLILGKTLYLSWLSISNRSQERKRFNQVVEKVSADWRKRGKTCLRIALKSNNPTLDPRITRSDESGAVVKLLYEGLTQLDNNGKAELAIAKSIKVSKDGTVFTFSLRKALWSNGDQVIAEDFVQSWRKALMPQIDSVHNYLFYCIKGAKKVYQKELPPETLGVKALDPETLEVSLAHPVPSFAEITAHWSYLPTYRDADRNPAWAQEGTLISNGPYKLASRHNWELILAKNPAYWNAKKIKMKEVSVTCVEGIEEELELFLQNRIDFARGIPFKEYPLFPHQEKIESASSGIYGLFLNTQRPPFNDKELRKALAAAIDRKKLFQTLNWTGKGAYSLLPPSLSLIDPPSYASPLEIFTEAYNELGLLSPIEIHYPQYPGRKKLIKAIQQQWQDKLQLKSTLIESSWESFFSRVRQGDFDVAAMAWIPWFSDPLLALDGARHYPSASNPAQWRNKHFIEAIDIASHELNTEKRQSWIKKAEQILLEEVPLIPLLTIEGSYFKAKSLQGIRAGKLYEFDLKWCFFQN